jgi:hypothetical protein
MKLKPLVITASIISVCLLASFLALCIACLSLTKKKHDGRIRDIYGRVAIPHVPTDPLPKHIRQRK